MTTQPLLATFSAGLLAMSALVSIAEAAGRPQDQRAPSQLRPAAARLHLTPAPAAQPFKIAVPRRPRDLDQPMRILPYPMPPVRSDKMARPGTVAQPLPQRPVLGTPHRPVPGLVQNPPPSPAQGLRPDPKVTLPPIGTRTPSDPRVTTPVPPYRPIIGTTRPASGARPVYGAPGVPVGPVGPIVVPPKGHGHEPGPKADGGNANNNAGAGQSTGGQVGRGGVAIDSSDHTVAVGKDGTFVIGGASANGGHNNGNATGPGAHTGNNAGRGGKVIDDRDYKIDPSQGSTIVVKADTAHGGSNNGVGSQGGHAGRGNGNGGKVIDDRDIVIKGGDQGNTIVIEKDQAVAGQNNGRGNGEAGRVIDKRDIKIEVDAGDKIIYGGREIRADAGDVVTIRNGRVHVDEN
jgi:hypothetical protein